MGRKKKEPYYRYEENNGRFEYELKFVILTKDNVLVTSTNIEDRAKTHIDRVNTKYPDGLAAYKKETGYWYTK